MKKMNPKFLVRPDDFHIFKIDERNGCYGSFSTNITYSDGTKPLPYKHFTFENLTKNYDFFPIDENDIDVYKKKHDEYLEFVCWQSRPDGHGGSKGGTWEEFLKTQKDEDVQIVEGIVNTRPVEFYHNLHYNIIIEKYSDKSKGDTENLFCAYTKEFGYYSCYGAGSTEKDALESFLVEKKNHINLLYKKNKKIPMPALDA
ncbi:MAG: hypothetical protein WC466_02865 [Candidatus Izemoplasmatales bacterium]